jgi:hypothetical protein
MDTATALVLLDVQQGFDNPHWGDPEAELNLAAFWQRSPRPRRASAGPRGPGPGRAPRPAASWPPARE